MTQGIDTIVDRFVEHLVSCGECIIPADQNPIVRLTEQQLELSLPPSFRSLISRYQFPALEVGDLRFFANTGEPTIDEWHDVLFQDKCLSSGLLAAGLVQFARPAGGSYDAICFDTTRKSKDAEYPLVWIDHEGILCDGRIVVIEVIAASLCVFMQNHV